MEIEVYALQIDYGLSFVQMIELGKFRWVSPNITLENFPKKDSGVEQKKLQIVSFRGLQNPAGLFELLALRDQHPTLDLRLVAATGSVYTGSDGKDYSPYIFEPPTKNQYLSALMAQYPGSNPDDITETILKSRYPRLDLDSEIVSSSLSAHTGQNKYFLSLGCGWSRSNQIRFLDLIPG